MADLELVVAGTDELRPSVLVEIRALLDAAFDDPDNPDEAFDDDDWDHTVGGTHVLVKDDDGQVISHASVVDRIVDVGGRPLRTGYVEGVATAKAFEGHGHGSRVMRRIAEVIAEPPPAGRARHRCVPLLRAARLGALAGAVVRPGRRRAPPHAR